MNREHKINFAKRVGIRTVAFLVALVVIAKLGAGKNEQPHLASWSEVVNELPLMVALSLVLALIVTAVGQLGKKR